MQTAVLNYPPLHYKNTSKKVCICPFKSCRRKSFTHLRYPSQQAARTTFCKHSDVDDAKNKITALAKDM